MSVRVGDTVRVIAPHPEAGAVGTVQIVYRANADYERRARVRFEEPYPGWQTVALRLLAPADHQMDASCWCQPTVEHLPDGDLFTHRSES